LPATARLFNKIHPIQEKTMSNVPPTSSTPPPTSGF
jgi:hypothetical protein